MKRKSFFSSIALLFFSMFVMSGVAFADPALVTLTSPSNTYTPGSTISVNIYINGNGSSLITGSIQVTYDSSKVSFISIEESGSAFTGGGIPPDTSSGSYIGLSKYQIGGISGSNLYFAKINFRANSAGTANFGLTSSTQISNSSGTNIYNSNGSSGKSISIQAPATTPTTPPASSPTTPIQPTPNSTNNPVNPSDQPLNASTTPSVASDGNVNQSVNAGEIIPENINNKADGITDYASTIVNPSQKYILPIIAVIAFLTLVVLIVRFTSRYIHNLKTVREFKNNTQLTDNSTHESDPVVQNIGLIIHPENYPNDDLNSKPNDKVQ